MIGKEVAEASTDLAGGRGGLHGPCGRSKRAGRHPRLPRESGGFAALAVVEERLVCNGLGYGGYGRGPRLSASSTAASRRSPPRCEKSAAASRRSPSWKSASSSTASPTEATVAARPEARDRRRFHGARHNGKTLHRRHNESAAATQEGIQNRIVEQIMDIPAPMAVEETIDEVVAAPQERIQNKTVGQIMDMLVPMVVEETINEVVAAPRSRIQNRIVEQIMDKQALMVVVETSTMMWPRPRNAS